MYIFLARQNVQDLSLGWGCCSRDRHLLGRLCELPGGPPHLALLRIRVPGRSTSVRFFLPNVFGPSLIGLVIGALISSRRLRHHQAGVDLRQLQTVMGYLPTRLAVLQETGIIDLV